jgi:hypothetical protein
VSALTQDEAPVRLYRPTIIATLGTMLLCNFLLAASGSGILVQSKNVPSFSFAGGLVLPVTDPRHSFGQDRVFDQRICTYWTGLHWRRAPTAQKDCAMLIINNQERF